MRDVVDLSAREQAGAMARGELSAETLMAATLARIAQVNPRFNAVVSMMGEGALMDRARAADGAAVRGPLHGLPVAIKDLCDAAGFETSQGSPIFAGQVAARDDLHVARMRGAGAIVIGKTNTPEFGLGSHTYNPVHGATGNAYDPSRSCGGSSGGAAVALAHGMVSLADGSDMMGSLRNPAGWNNVYGMRPSWGRVPGAGGDDLYQHQLSTHGPMARTPGDLALLLSVIEGADRGQPLSWGRGPIGPLVPKVAGLRIGWLGDWGGALAYEPGILELCEGALEVFRARGCTVEAVDPPFDSAALWQSWLTLRAWANAGSLGPLMARADSRAQLKPEVIWEVEQGLALSGQQIEAASAIRSAWFRRSCDVFARYDALILPTAQVWPFAMDATWPRAIGEVVMDTYHRWMEVMIPASLIGLPAVAVPVGFGAEGGAGVGADGLPMGMQIIGRFGADQGVLELAQAYHAATDWPGRVPGKC